MSKTVNIPCTHVSAYRYLKKKYGKELVKACYNALDISKNELPLPLYSTAGNGVDTFLALEIILSKEVHNIDIPIVFSSEENVIDNNIPCIKLPPESSQLRTLTGNIETVLQALVEARAINVKKRILVYSVGRVELKFASELKVWQEPYITKVKFYPFYSYDRSDVNVLRKLLASPCEYKINWLRLDYVDKSTKILVGASDIGRNPRYVFLDFVGTVGIRGSVSSFSTSLTEQEEIKAIRKELHGNS